MSKIPDNISAKIRVRLWKQADEVGWTRLKSPEKTAYYEQWSKASGIGNILERYLDGKNVRVYLKDVIMKPYGRARINDPDAMLRLLHIPAQIVMRDLFVKPHGRICSDGKTIAWGLAKDWKSILFAVYERAMRAPGATPHAAILMNPDGKMRQPFERKLVEEAASRLGITKVLWPDVAVQSEAIRNDEPILL